MTELWMNHATPKELKRYVNNRSVQAIRKHLGQISESESARSLSDYVRRIAKIRIGLILLMLSCFSVGATIIPETRLYPWGPFTGVEGGIPNVTTVFDDDGAASGDNGVAGNGITDGLESIDNTGATVVRTAFQAALDNCPSNQVIGIPAGVFLLVDNGETESLSWQNDGIVMRGRGPGATTLVNKGASGGTQTILIQKSSFDYDFASVTKYNISGDLVNGDSNITTTVSHAFNVGDYVYIDQRTNTGYIFMQGSSGSCTFCAGANRAADQRTYGMVSRVVAVPAGNQLRIQPPITVMGFQSTNSPQIMSANNMVQRAGIESLTFSNASTATAQYWFDWVGVANSWSTNVEFSSSRRRFIDMKVGFRNTIVQNYMHHGIGSLWTAAYGADRAYGIFLAYGSSFNRIEDNICDTMHFFCSHEGAIAGNASYGNFHTNQIFSDRYTSQPNLGHHGAAATGNLWEHNNVNSTLTFDYIWGGGSAYTIFRNRVKLDAQHDGVNVDQLAICIDIATQHRFYNIVGNVLGTANIDKVHPVNGDQFTQDSGMSYIYRLGYTDAFDPWDDTLDDDAVTGTMILKNNYCITSGSSAVPAAESVGGTNMPLSLLYGSTKPTWWGVSNWPSIGPDLSPTVEGSMWTPAYGRWLGIKTGSPTNWFAASQAPAPIKLGRGKQSGRSGRFTR